MHPEARILLGERIEVFLEKDVLRSDVGEDEVHLRLVASSTALDDRLDDLEHGGDPGSARDHAKVSHHVRGVDERALGTADPDGLPDMDARQVLGDVASRVGLHQKVEVAGLVITGDGRVRAHNLLARAVRLGDAGTDGDVLADRQAQDGRQGRELEPVTKIGMLVSASFQVVRAWSNLHGNIVGYNRLLLELELLEGRGEHLLRD